MRRPSTSRRVISAAVFSIIITIIAAIIGAVIILIFSLTSPQQSIAPSPPYKTYESATDIPGLTLKITWDNPVIQNQSIALSCSMQPTDISKLQDQFGPNNDLFLMAQLNASAFTIDPKEQTQQSITEHTISFYWTATPTLTGKQAINLNVTGIWIPRQDGKQITHYLGDHIWHVQVGEPQAPFFTLGQISLGALVTVFLSAILAFPLWEIVRKRFGF